MRRGDWLRDAAARAGLHRDTVYGWLERADEAPPADAEPRVEHERYVAFALAFRAAEAAVKARWTARVRKGGLNWKAWAWMLERRFPAEFGRRLHTELSGSVVTSARVVVLPSLDAVTVESALGPEPGTADEIPGLPGR